MEKETEQKSCKNCAHYIHYYIKEKLRYKQIDNGHCRERIRLKGEPTVCEHWQNVAVKHEENEKSLKEALQSLSKRLNKIAAYLSDYDKE